MTRSNADTARGVNFQQLADVTDLATAPGNTTNGYGRGFANGLILARAIMAGEQPVYIERANDQPVINDALQAAVNAATAS